MSFHNITIRMQKVCYTRRCFSSDTNCNVRFFRFPRNPQQ